MNTITQSNNNLLQLLIDRSKITATDILDLEMEMNKRELKQLHTYAINKLGDGRFKTTVKTDNGRKSIVARTEHELWEKLADWYCIKGQTFKAVFEEMCQYRLANSFITEKTYTEYNNVFKRFFENSPFIRLPIKDITFKDMKQFFDYAHTCTTTKGTTNKSITRANQRDCKTIINKTFSYANNTLNMNLINPLPLIDFSEYKITSRIKNEFYSDDETTLLLNHLQDYPKKDCYDYAILLNIDLGLRIGELKALKWTDIDFINKVVHIHSQILEQPINGHKQNTYVEHTKTNNEEGERYLPLSDRALSLLTEIKNTPFDDEFVFKKDTRFMLTCTYNRHLEKHCKAIGITYKSSHKIRFGFATRIVGNGCPLNVASSILGHTNVQTTSRYVKIANKSNINADMLCYMGI